MYWLVLCTCLGVEVREREEVDVELELAFVFAKLVSAERKMLVEEEVLTFDWLEVELELPLVELVYLLAARLALVVVY